MEKIILEYVIFLLKIFMVDAIIRQNNQHPDGFGKHIRLYNYIVNDSSSKQVTSINSYCEFTILSFKLFFK